MIPQSNLPRRELIPDERKRTAGKILALLTGKDLAPRVRETR